MIPIYEYTKKGGKNMYRSSVYAKNRPSPADEDDYRRAYLKVCPWAEKEDNYDISAVITFDGFYGHALMHYTNNRSHDKEYHICTHFVSDDELRNNM